MRNPKSLKLRHSFESQPNTEMIYQRQNKHKKLKEKQRSNTHVIKYIEYFQFNAFIFRYYTITNVFQIVTQRNKCIINPLPYSILIMNTKATS